jgi:hypothetical protein
MYSGNDLIAVVNALDALCADDFFQYDFNVGTVIPYLKISISRTQIANFPSIQYLEITRPYLDVFYTLDFSAPSDVFISRFQSSCSAYAALALPVWQAMYDHGLTFQTFLDKLESKVP